MTASSTSQFDVNLQPHRVVGLAKDERAGLLISTVQIDGQWQVRSRYGDDIWFLSEFPTNARPSARFIDFRMAPSCFREVLRAMLFRYLRSGRKGRPPPKGSQLRSFFMDSKSFLGFVNKLGIEKLSEITPSICGQYVSEVRAYRNRAGKPYTASHIFKLYLTVEAIHELSAHTDDKMLWAPWSDSSSAALAGLTAGQSENAHLSLKTPRIPDDAFCAMFQAAWRLVEQGEWLLDLRDGIDRIALLHATQCRQAVQRAKNSYLAEHGWTRGLRDFNETLLDLRTACYIVVASLSGCRAHELGYLQTSSCYLTKDDDDETYWWMKSKSTKTPGGDTEWMIPEAAATALKAVDRWCRPHQATIWNEIESRRKLNSADPEIAEAREHARSVFVGTSKAVGTTRTLSSGAWTQELNRFARKNGVRWTFSSHQFRRTFATYAARSQFGDLRYLKEHFKHWSFDMTLGYAMNEYQEIALYSEVYAELADNKERLVEAWLKPGEPLAGGLGTRLMDWRAGRTVTMFKDRASMVKAVSDSVALRSNGHAWCTADQGIDCVGNSDLELTRCTDCHNSVIGDVHARVYQGVYNHLKSVLNCEDIGEGGRLRVRRDVERCATVLHTLGYNPELGNAV